MKPRSREEIIAKEAATHRPARILDIAYAHGLNRALAQTGAELYGLDPLARPSAEYTKISLCDINTDPIPFGDAEFDMVTMGCVLAHTARPLEVLAKVHRVLKPGGILILSSPSPNYYWENVLNIFYQHFAKRVSKSKHVEHFFEFTRYAMRTSLERAGFILLKELGSTFHVVKTKLRLNVEKWPGLAFEIIYVAKKIGEPSNFTIIEDDQGAIINLKTNLFS
jgi:ubiquinone/menaquinone biosynthesis C-methylase UbiE